MRRPIPCQSLLFALPAVALPLACGGAGTADVEKSSLPEPAGAEASAGVRGLDELTETLRELMDRGGVPGAALALVSDGTVVGVRGLGEADVSARSPVTPDTVFEAASLSKPVFAYAVMKLRERGELELDLDRPLSEYLSYEDIRDDPRAARITARMVLSHTTGFPNWRPGRWTDDPGPLVTRFEPGTEFGYSGEGFAYLQRVVEHLTGSSLEKLAVREVFEPLGMGSSTYIPPEEGSQTMAMPHDFLGEVQEKRGTEALASGSLHTTAGDYARFVAEVLRPRHEGGAEIEAMLTPQVEVEEGVSWGLGWGLEDWSGERVFWHWGDNVNFHCFVMASPGSGDGVVFFTNSNNGLAIAEPLVEEVFGGGHPAFAWMGYDRYDAPGFQVRRRLVGAGLADGADGVAAAVAEIRERYAEEDLTERLVNRIGYDLLGRDRVEAAIAVFEWNVERFPGAWNVYDSLAEAYAEKGETSLAIRYYEKSLELNPANDNAVAMLAKLRVGAGG